MDLEALMGLLRSAYAGEPGMQLRMAPSPEMDSPLFPTTGAPLKLRMAPGLYTSGMGNSLDLPVMPAWLQRYVLENHLGRVPGSPLISEGKIGSAPILMQALGGLR
jgi:hypothetical protein